MAKAFYKTARFIKLVVVLVVFLPIAVFYTFVNKTSFNHKIFKKLNHFTASRVGIHEVLADIPSDCSGDGDCGGCCGCDSSGDNSSDSS